MLRKKADLIIGNPPWLVLHNIHSDNYKEQVKSLASALNILPEAHVVTHLEMSALFLYIAKRFLKNEGRVFFVVSNAFATGDNHDGTRQFLEYDNIVLWKFTKDIFNIHNICLSAIYREKLVRSFEELENLEVKKILFKPQLTRARRWIFSKEKEEIEKPYSILKKDKKSILVKKLLPLEEIKYLLPKGKNAYEKICYNGAALFPRNLIFVKIENDDGNYYEISHHIESPKERWAFDPKKRLKLGSIKIEKEFIFSVLKSKGVIPFVSLNPNFS